jgi:hypothetical protein
MHYHPIFLLIGLVTVAGTLVSLRRQHIRTEYSASWLVGGIILTALAAFPNTLDVLAKIFGASPDAVYLTAGGTLISALVFEVTRVVSRLRDENVMLAQRVAILEYRIREFGKDGTKDIPE